MISIPVALAIAAVCIVLEAFFSGSEIAMVSADRALLKQKVAEGSTGAELAEWFLDRPHTLLSTTLFGTNMALVTSSTVLTLTMLEHFPDAGEIIAIAALAPAVLIFGEIVPKTMFQQHADRLVTRLVYPLRVASIVFYPVVFLLQRFSVFASRLLSIREREALVTREELLLLLESSKERPGDQAITEDERTMISNVLEFNETTVDNVMLPLSEVTALPDTAGLDEVVAEIADKQHTRIPIYHDRVDQITGVLHAFDALRAIAQGKQVSMDKLARSPIYVPESKPAVDLLVELQRSGQQLAVVVDEYGGATGICTVEDLLEEIVGEIEDEYDRGPSPIRPESPGVYRVEARTAIVQINEELNTELPESDEYESIAGLLLDRLKRIPTTGESVRIAGVTITVVAATERAVSEVKIRIGKGR